MAEVVAFNGKLMDIGNCMGCFCGTTNNPGKIVKSKYFDISQDFELPINGFIVIGSLRHVKSINDLTSEEKLELIKIIDIVLLNLKKLNVCKEYDVVWEEKENSHFHVWLMPRHQELLDVIGCNFIKKIGELFNYAKSNLRTSENLKAINNTINYFKKELTKYKMFKISN